MTYEEARQIDVEEFATESRDLMRRALAYAAEKRAEEVARFTSAKPAPSAQFNRQGIGTSVYELDGKHMSLPEWCAHYEIDIADVRRRLKAGWTLDAALKTRKGTARAAKLYDLDGVEKPIAAWALEHGISLPTVMSRLYTDWTLKQALGIAPRERKQRTPKVTPGRVRTSLDD
ncbi:hypothetical protein NDN16_10470 [Aureimonas altamirensis]|uniref:hypothetical protein n=1 Tax=Aureimonas altamirensis TaxID=370622 RepID=UPI0020372DB4|nr:hypothetical protein [Aureimonas altamirensis]MCM2504095.1 hypothetical protein [Aureimonas altamirensis]